MAHGAAWIAYALHRNGKPAEATAYINKAKTWAAGLSAHPWALDWDDKTIILKVYGIIFSYVKNETFR